MVTLGSIRLTVRLVKWLIKWLRENKKRKGGITWGVQGKENKEKEAKT